MLETLKHLTLNGRSALVVALATGSAALLLRRVARARGAAAAAVLREATVVLVLFSVWMYLGSRSLGASTAADARGRALLRVEQHLHLAVEGALQRGILGHPLLVQAANYAYACLHFPAMIGFLAWAFVRHRPGYRQVRLRVVLVTAGCMLVQFLPVAPPRLVPQAHLVDTAMRYHQSVYAAGPGVAQLSAMPSVHVAWSVLIAWEVLRLTCGRGRWVLLHPLVTVYVVSVTGNHWVLDGVAGAAVVLMVGLADHAVRGRRRGTTAGPAATAAGADRDAAVA